MIGALVLAALAAPQGEAIERAGPVWLAGDSADLPSSELPALLLVAAAPRTPEPLDARRFGGGAHSAVLDVRGELGPLVREQLERVRGARRLLLGPGTLADWRAALWQENKPSALQAALREAWLTGAAVVARGACAGLLGQGYLDLDVQAAERNARAGDVPVVRQGLGLVRFATLETQARGGGFAPLGRRLLSTGVGVTLWIPAGGLVRVEPGRGLLTGSGEAPVLVFDGRGSKRTGLRVAGVAVTWIGAGSSWSADDARRTHDRPSVGTVEAEPVADPWSVERWLAAAPAPGGRRAWSAGGMSVRLLGLELEEPGSPRAVLELERDP